MDHFPNFRGENKTCLKKHLALGLATIFSTTVQHNKSEEENQRRKNTKPRWGVRSRWRSSVRTEPWPWFKGWMDGWMDGWKRWIWAKLEEYFTNLDFPPHKGGGFPKPKSYLSGWGTRFKRKFHFPPINFQGNMLSSKLSFSVSFPTLLFESRCAPNVSSNWRYVPELLPVTVEQRP